MANKAARSPDGKEKEQLLAALRQAMDGQPRLLQGTSAKRALFPAGSKGAGAATRALAEGYLAEYEPPSGVKIAATGRYVRLTDRGKQFLREEESPKQLLETLLPVITHLAAKLEDTADSLCEVMNIVEGLLLEPREVPLPAEGAAAEEDEEEAGSGSD
jgi:hypothetical protein